jgi:HSP20 family protein
MEGLTMILRRLGTFPDWTSTFRELDETRREMDRLFDSLSLAPGFRSAGVFPPINVSESKDGLFVRAELPGVKVEQLDIQVEDTTLTIAGERQMSREGAKVSYHRREREWGAFRRSFQLPTRVDAQNTRARYRDGILTIELPKAPEARPKQIAIQAGA